MKMLNHLIKESHSNFTFSPAARMTNCPSSAGFLLPDTGASRKEPPFAITAFKKKKKNYV